MPGSAGQGGKRRMIDLRQLRYFVAIVEEGSFSRAAQVLHVAQPALSLHVRNMESDLGAALLFRSPRGVQPTEAGLILLRHARRIMDQILAAEEEIRGFGKDPSGIVRLGLPGTISQIIAVPLVKEVHRLYPRVQLRIAEAMSGFVRQWLKEGSIDMAVLYGEARDQGLDSHHILDEGLHLIGTPAMAQRDGLDQDVRPGGSALSLAQALALPLILPSENHSLRRLLADHAAAAGVPLSTLFDVDSFSNIKALVQDSMGYSVLPVSAVAAEMAEGRLSAWPIGDPPIRRSIHLSLASDRPQTNAVTAVLALLQTLLTDLVQTRYWPGAILAGSAASLS